MYDFLKFIDSPDIREFNKDTVFTPAEQAVLVSKSYKTTVEEKIEALQYLADNYTEEEFHKDSIKCGRASGDGGVRIRDVVLETIRVWKCALDVRYHNDGFIYSVEVGERELYGSSRNYGYFTDYGKACERLLKVKKEYTDVVDEGRDKPTVIYGEIRRIKLDDRHKWDRTYYCFDHDMRLVSLINDEDWGNIPYLINEYLAFVPLPFKKGDIVKVESLTRPTYYGVVSHDWERSEDTDCIIMWISLDIYNRKSKDLDHTDGTGDCVLSYSFCSYEELPEDEEMLKLISDVRRDDKNLNRLLRDMDLDQLLRKFGRNGVNQLLEWRREKILEKIYRNGRLCRNEYETE